MNTLYIISRGIDKPSDQKIRELEESDQMPRVSLLEKEINATILDERYLNQRTPGWRRRTYRFLPVRLSQIIETLFIRRNFDVIMCHSEPVSLPFAFIKRILRIKTPFAMLVSRITSMYEHKTRQKKWLLKHSHQHVDAILMWSSKQRDILVHEMGIPESKVSLIKRGTDHRFWRPQERETDMISSVGMEMRDYPTLIKALNGTHIPCHLAMGLSRGELFETVQKVYEHQDIPKHITIGYKSQTELRDLYARSRFVIIPLLPTDSDNGLTAILEAMAMGRPVICSRVEGQIDVIQPGVTGFYVPQGDPDALREAILELWNNPALAKSMGRAARTYIEENRTINSFARSIRNVLDKITLQPELLNEEGLTALQNQRAEQQTGEEQSDGLRRTEPSQPYH